MCSSLQKIDDLDEIIPRCTILAILIFVGMILFFSKKEKIMAKLGKKKADTENN